MVSMKLRYAKSQFTSQKFKSEKILWSHSGVCETTIGGKIFFRQDNGISTCGPG